MANIFSGGFSVESFSKADDLKKRILFTIMALFVYRIGTYIPIPGLDPLVIEELARRYTSGSGIIGMFNMFSGGALSRMTVFALNLMPYISASIIIQLFTLISPTLAALKKEGETGRNKINQYTRYLTVGICTIQAYGISLLLMNANPCPVVHQVGWIFPVIAVPSLVGGTLFLVWLGEQMTSRGVGNGSSLLIFAGIVANMPHGILNIFELGKGGVISPLMIVTIFLATFLVILFVVFIERAQRKVTIHYPQRRAGLGSGNNQVSPDGSHLPLKINSAGVIPPIFASSLLSLPAVMLSYFAGSDNPVIMSIIASFHRGGWIFNAIFIVLLVVFAFFYTAVMFNSEETADNLKKSGGFVPGIRPGIATAEYFDYILTRLTSVGAIYLAFVCLFPDIIREKTGVQLFVGGTGLLIIVGVTIDTISQIYTHLLAQQYSGVLKKLNRRK